MRTLTVFYDPTCGLCTSFKHWMAVQAAYLKLEFIAYNSDKAKDHLPFIETLEPDKEIIVQADDGRWWQGPPAWLTCLWALRDYREWSYRLRNPRLLPLVENTCHMISQHRFKLSKLLRLTPDELAKTIEAEAPECPTGNCVVSDKRPGVFY